jgi:hypothetical protein
MVILKHWHKLPLVENQIAPANSVERRRGEEDEYEKKKIV